MARRWLRSIPFALVSVCLAGAVTVSAGLASGVLPAGVAYGMLVGCALMWRRRRPVATFVAVSLVTFGIVPVLMLGSQLDEYGLVIGLGAAMYAVVKYARRLLAGALAAVVTVIAAAVVMVHGGERYANSPDQSIGHAVMLTLPYVACTLLLALAARVRHLQLVGLRDRAADAERERDHLARIAVAEERARIARELHDIVAHSLSVMIVHSNGAQYALDHDRERVRAALRTIGRTGQDALGEMKQLVQLLRSDGGDPGLDPSPVALEQLDAVVERARGAGLAVDLVVDGTPPPVSGGVALAVYRIVQEALTNTLKHAGPMPAATVRVRYRLDAIELEVTDTGDGPAGDGSGGHGLVGMRERVNLYGGAFEAGPNLNGGWRVRAHIPLGGAPDRAVTA